MAVYGTVILIYVYDFDQFGCKDEFSMGNKFNFYTYCTKFFCGYIGKFFFLFLYKQNSLSVVLHKLGITKS